MKMNKKLMVIVFSAFFTTTVQAFDGEKVAETVSEVVNTVTNAASSAVSNVVAGSNVGKVQTGQLQNHTQENQGGTNNINAVNFNNQQTMVTAQGLVVNGTVTQTNRYGDGNVNGLNVNKADTGLLIQHLDVNTLKQKNIGGRNNINCGNCSLASD